MSRSSLVHRAQPAVKKLTRHTLPAKSVSATGLPSLLVPNSVWRGPGAATPAVAAGAWAWTRGCTAAASVVAVQAWRKARLSMVICACQKGVRTCANRNAAAASLGACRLPPARAPRGGWVCVGGGGGRAGVGGGGGVFFVGGATPPPPFFCAVGKP